MVREIHHLWVILCPTYNHKLMAEHLAVGKDIPLRKYLLGATYHLMHQVAAQFVRSYLSSDASGSCPVTEEQTSAYY